MEVSEIDAFRCNALQEIDGLNNSTLRKHYEKLLGNEKFIRGNQKIAIVPKNKKNRKYSEAAKLVGLENQKIILKLSRKRRQSKKFKKSTKQTKKAVQKSTKEEKKPQKIEKYQKPIPAPIPKPKNRNLFQVSKNKNKKPKPSPNLNSKSALDSFLMSMK